MLNENQTIECSCHRKWIKMHKLCSKNSQETKFTWWIWWIWSNVICAQFEPKAVPANTSKVLQSAVIERNCIPVRTLRAGGVLSVSDTEIRAGGTCIAGVRADSPSLCWSAHQMCVFAHVLVCCSGFVCFGPAIWKSQTSDFQMQLLHSYYRLPKFNYVWLELQPFGPFGAAWSVRVALSDLFGPTIENSCILDAILLEMWWKSSKLIIFGSPVRALHHGENFRLFP